MRKRKQPLLGPERAVRSIPVTTAEPVHDRRLLIPLEPSLADLAAGLLPGELDAQPAAWTSWAPHDQPSDDASTYWEVPAVDGATYSGGGVGFPEGPTDSTAITIDDITSAEAAGWPYAAGAPDRGHSWVGALAGLGLESEEVSAATNTNITPYLEVRSTTTPPSFPPNNVQDAMALHPSGRAAPPAEAPEGIDAKDFAIRLQRGASIASNELQLHALAARAFDRLAPGGSGMWFAEQSSGRLAPALSDPEDGACCGVVERHSCPAIFTGVTQRFENSDGLDSCPHLSAAGGPPCAAVCVPVGAQGPLRGVLLVRMPTATVLDDATVILIEHVASTIAQRVAEVRGAVGSNGSAD